MVKKTVIYIISPRSALSIKPGRKISSIIELWSKKYNLITFFGGDILNSGKSTESIYGNYTGNEKSYRKSKLLEPLIHTVSEIKDIIHNIQSYYFLKKQYSNKNIKLVWERSSRLHFAGLIFAKKYNIPYVLEWKDNLINYKCSLLKPIALYFERYKCNQADIIVVESNILKQMLMCKGISSDKIEIAYNAADSNDFSRDLELGQLYRKSISIPNGMLLIGYLGSYAFYHDSMRLILAVEILKKRGYENKIKFLLVGNGKDYKKCLFSAKEKDLLNNILLIKDAVRKEDVPRILSAIDISILPGSTDIICPIKVLEYMSAQTATIVPDYPCNREIIDDGVNGLFFKPKDEIDLANKIELLILNPNFISILGVNAKQTVKDKFSWQATWGEVLDVVLEKLTRSSYAN